MFPHGFVGNSLLVAPEFTEPLQIDWMILQSCHPVQVSLQLCCLLLVYPGWQDGFVGVALIFAGVIRRAWPGEAATVG